MRATTFAAALLPALALARTDLVGCTSSVSGPSLIWYVPGTGELCDFLDCGGGRAPPKTTVPGCAAYVGTATYSPSYLPGWGPDATPSVLSSSTPAKVTGGAHTGAGTGKGGESSWATKTSEVVSKAGATGKASITYAAGNGTFVAAPTKGGASPSKSSAGALFSNAAVAPGAGVYGLAAAVAAGAAALL
ncbi:hypothetical protein EJ06DRAFT_351149 [Trichodelitschia bisporula]|uniref:Siderophore biosynthesis enzyme n=1 Tax=Trichodelitschia bisporula TaxID=703511 RepID=A0A6G1I0L1_9PEZI|nr:hypothetical protein EJ06DRAFT_351149 [Trichodelitschia bisporula]